MSVKSGNNRNKRLVERLAETVNSALRRNTAWTCRWGENQISRKLSLLTQTKTESNLRPTEETMEHIEIGSRVAVEIINYAPGGLYFTDLEGTVLSLINDNNS